MTEEQKKIKKYVNAIERHLHMSLKMKARINSDLATEIHLRMEAGATADEVIQEMGRPKEVAERFNEEMGAKMGKKSYSLPGSILYSNVSCFSYWRHHRKSENHPGNKRGIYQYHRRSRWSCVHIYSRKHFSFWKRNDGSGSGSRVSLCIFSYSKEKKQLCYKTQMYDSFSYRFSAYCFSAGAVVAVERSGNRCGNIRIHMASSDFWGSH